MSTKRVHEYARLWVPLYDAAALAVTRPVYLIEAADGFEGDRRGEEHHADGAVQRAWAGRAGGSSRPRCGSATPRRRSRLLIDATLDEADHATSPDESRQRGGHQRRPGRRGDRVRRLRDAPPGQPEEVAVGLDPFEHLRHRELLQAQRVLGTGLDLVPADRGGDLRACGPPERVRRHGGLRAGVLRPVEEHLAAAPGLRHRRGDQFAVRGLQAPRRSPWRVSLVSVDGSGCSSGA
nr:hypothetical protein [Nocardioides convexus]